MRLYQGLTGQISRYKPLILTFAVLFVIGALGGYFIISTQQKALNQQFYDSGIALADSIIHSLQHDMIDGASSGHIQAALADLTDNGNLKEVTIISPDMRVFASSDSSLTGTLLADAEVARLLATGETIVHSKEKEKGDIVGIIVPLKNEPACMECHDSNLAVLGAVELHLSTAGLDDYLIEQTMLLVIIGGLTLLTVGTSGYLVLRRVVIQPFSNRITQLLTERGNIDRLYATDRLASVGELASGIAHEINNPLTSVVGFSDLILERELPDEVREELQIINKEAQRASQIVRNLLSFSRKHPLEKKPVNINELIEMVLAMRSYEQGINNIQVNTHLAPDLPEIIGDPFQLQQVFLNIIVNAEYFMARAHKGGILDISTERRDSTIRLIFADDGPGIPEKNKMRLFDPFFTTKEVGQGTGLGLSIVHGIVKEHRGTITAESEPGKGAIFIIELPVFGD